MSDEKEKEQFFANARKRGYPDDETENTWELMEVIQEALDGDPYLPPEAQHLPKVRLARLFIDRQKELVKKNDVAIAWWLRSLDVDAGPAIASDVEKGEHWKWFHKQKGKRT